MFSGNLYGLIIVLLAIVATIVMAGRQLEERGIRFEILIQSVPAAKSHPGRESEDTAPKARLRESKPDGILAGASKS
jgi:hypothetical protein